MEVASRFAARRHLISVSVLGRLDNVFVPSLTTSFPALEEEEPSSRIIEMLSASFRMPMAIVFEGA